MKNTLADLVDRNVLPNDQDFIAAVELACQQSQAFLAVVNFAKPAYEFVSVSCRDVTGYSHETYMEGGPQFIFSTTTPEAALKIVQNQNEFAQHARVPGFEPANTHITEFKVDFHSDFGYVKEMVVLGLPLTYTPDKDIHIGIAKHVSIGSNNDVNDKIIQDCKQHLANIKTHHNRSFRHDTTITKKKPLQKVFIQERPELPLSMREEEVLKLMAKGLTSLEIADRLSIAENTVESHRKNLFQKLEARNVAELIKKASKLYWLE